MDCDSLSGALGRTFDADQRERIVQAQHAGYRRTFLVSGMVNASFVKVMKGMDGDGAASVAQKAANLS